ncbi:TRAP transporter small permease subunit [Algihabitans albus]|uniref:TRAP transporter small permease subunit n=1 Tax=Algihabitans albus TaxID=2164067 RepID=UPI000E5D1B31|nr:TRAP transporter small permease subunit [Algihabitans albus]
MHRLVSLFDAVAGLALALLLAVTAAGILTRLLFDLTAGGLDLLLSDAVEMATYALLITVFAAMPRALRDGPVTIEVFSRHWPLWLTAILDRLWSLLFGILAVLLAWRYAGESLTLLARGDTTQDMQLPLWGFYAFAVVAFAAAALVGLSLGFGRSGRGER